MASISAGSATTITTVSVSIYYRFTNCCTGEVFNFKGTIPAFVNNNVYTSQIDNVLTRGECYTVTQLNTQDTVFWNSLPSINNESISYTAPTCDNGKCPSCEEPCGVCPEGYTQVGNECIKEENVPATYTGGLVTVTAGSKFTSYNKFGLRLYPDITSDIKPLLGSGNPYQVIDNNGTGSTIVPLISGVQSTLWGCEVPAACSTFTGPSSTYGGRLNIAGLWAPGYNADGDGPELGFDFCVNIEETKQYLVGIAGDNKVKLYVDGVLNVFLNAGGSGGTAPFNWWHVFPITLTAGQHIIRLSGINNGFTNAAFAGEIYDIDVATFQATLTDPAIGLGNCGNVPLDLEPFIVFSTRDMINEQIPNPAQPGVWQCPDGSTPDYCTGVPQCTIEEKLPFPICPCYLLIPCDGTHLPIISNSPELATYIDDYVAVYTQDGEEPFCVYVVDYVGEEVCETAINVFIDGDVQCPCPPQCYYISNASGIITVNSADGLVELTPAETYPYVKLCSNTYPLVGNADSDYQIISLGDCVDGVCPVQCYKLVNCNNPELVIYTNSDSVLPYLYGTNNVVKVIGREGCWTVKNLDPEEVCDCPVDVIVTTSYSTCEECIGYIAYRLVSCTDNDVIYTLLNLEEYVGQVVKLDCGCYSVQQINYLPANPQVIKLEDIYTNCTECTRPYWKLEDCAGIAEPIITYTDLTLYEGKTVKIQNCTECWTVTSTTEHLNATTVNVLLEYADCQECDVDIPCQCSTLTNYSTDTKTYVYLDCEYNLVEITLGPGETSDRTCVLRWYATDYCNCFILKYTVGDVTQAVTATATESVSNGFPVYSVCTGPRCGTAAWNGTQWVIYDDLGAPLYTLTNSTSTICPFGTWTTVGTPPVGFRMESYECPQTCNCIDLSVFEKEQTTQYNLTISGYDENQNPIYTDTLGNVTIVFNEQTQCWGLYYGISKFPIASLCDNIDCPVGAFTPTSPSESTYVTKDCTIPPFVPDFALTDYIQYFGNCQNGVCLPPTFKNNRTVKPGYNTPNCNPDRYDEITCKFADIMYKIVLEKRYGITNCCPEDDEKWLLKKELIDLQALKDPNYHCPECPCSCNSGKSYSSCNCGN